MQIWHLSSLPHIWFFGETSVATTLATLVSLFESQCRNIIRTARILKLQEQNYWEEKRSPEG